MVSQLNVEQERNEIAVLKSRGASPGQIFGLYSMEAGLLGLVTFVVSPLIGLLLCRFLGVSDGFMDSHWSYYVYHGPLVRGRERE